MAEITTLTTQSGFKWVDIYNPKKSDIQKLENEYSLHFTSVEDCLDPEHLPKFEKLPTYNFLMLRAFDERCSSESDSVQELTRKVAIFFSDKFLITIHRKDQAFLAQLRQKWAPEFSNNPNVNGATVLFDLLKSIYLTFEQPIDNGLNQLEQHEMEIFNAHGSKPFDLEDGYFLKRKAFVFKRILRMSIDTLPKISTTIDSTSSPYFQDLKETLENIYFYADELVESTNSLLGLYISLQQQRTSEASHRTNEVMRVLTIFSIFFLPLNFMASLYGMNFKYMPELELTYAYPTLLTIMVGTAIAIFLWFRRKGWM